MRVCLCSMHACLHQYFEIFLKKAFEKPRSQTKDTKRRSERNRKRRVPHEDRNTQERGRGEETNAERISLYCLGPKRKVQTRKACSKIKIEKQPGKDEKGKEKGKRDASHYVGRAAGCRLFTSAVPLLFHAEGFVCSVSSLDRYPSLQRPGHHKFPCNAHVHTELSMDA